MRYAGEGETPFSKGLFPFPRTPILFPKTFIFQGLITNIPSLPEPMLNDARSPIMPRIHRIFPKIFSGIKKAAARIRTTAFFTAGRK